MNGYNHRIGLSSTHTHHDRTHLQPGYMRPPHAPPLPSHYQEGHAPPEIPTVTGIPISTPPPEIHHYYHHTSMPCLFNAPPPMAQGNAQGTSTSSSARPISFSTQPNLEPHDLNRYSRTNTAPSFSTQPSLSAVSPLKPSTYVHSANTVPPSYGHSPPPSYGPSPPPSYGPSPPPSYGPSPPPSYSPSPPPSYGHTPPPSYGHPSSPMTNSYASTQNIACAPPLALTLSSFSVGASFRPPTSPQMYAPPPPSLMTTTAPSVHDHAPPTPTSAIYEYRPSGNTNVYASSPSPPTRSPHITPNTRSMPKQHTISGVGGCPYESRAFPPSPTSPLVYGSPVPANPTPFPPHWQMGKNTGE